MSDVIKLCTLRALPKHLEQAAATAAVAENPENSPGKFPSPRFGVSPVAHATRMALLTGKKWKNGRTLRVHFMEGSPTVQAKVKEQAIKWMEFANINFQFVNDPTAEIRIAFKDDGSWSYLGTDALTIPKKDHTMNFGWLEEDTEREEYSRVVKHEFGHALGCIHEHQHPQAGIPWDKEKVYKYYLDTNGWSRDEVDAQLFKLEPASQTQFSKFDKTSIMCYAVPNSLTIGDYSIGWNTDLSSTDKDFIALMYPKTTASGQLVIGGPAVQANVGKHGQSDAYQFVVSSLGSYVIETQGETDVVMTVAPSNNPSNILAEDDDSGVGRNSRIGRLFEPGTYIVRVRHYQPAGTGNYSITVRAGSIFSIP